MQWILIAMLGLSVISGAMTGYFEANHAIEPPWSEFASTLILIVLTLSWYHVDSNEHNYVRSIWLNMLILGLAIIGIPYYLINSRAKGKKLAALGWLTVFVCLFMSLNMVGELLMSWL